MAAITPVGVRFVAKGFTAFNSKMKIAGKAVLGFGKGILSLVGKLSALFSTVLSLESKL